MKTILFTTILMACISCGKKEDSSSDATNPLSGTGWASSCTDKTITKDSFQADSMTRVVSVYADGNCTDLNYQIEMSRNYSVSGGNLDLTAKSTVLTMKDQDFLIEANTEKVYGKEDWELGVAKDISGLKVDGADTNPVPKVSDKRYQIFKIDGSKISYGDTSGADDGLTSDKRPMNFDPIIFTRI